MKPVCARCRTVMYVAKNGVDVVVHASFGPYEVWQGDLYRCPECGAEVITAWGAGPLAQHFEEDFASFVESAALHVVGPKSRLPRVSA